MSLYDYSLHDLARIIERDSKDSTYKYALLRGTIDIIQNFPHYKTVSEEGVSYPMGLLVLRWMEYYYPIIKNGIEQRYVGREGRSIAFRQEFMEVIRFYPGYSNHFGLFYDLRKGISDAERASAILKLARKIRETIAKQPMHYIGSAIGKGGEIYRYKPGSRGTIGAEMDQLITKLGSFSIPFTFNHVLSDIGSFVSGTHSIIFRWAEFTSNLNHEKDFSTGDIVSLLADSESERDVLQSRDFFKNILEHETLLCVWSGKKLNKDMHMDHMLPFSALQNNDLWNLLPADPVINNRKRDSIPTTGLLSEGIIRRRILNAWERLAEKFEKQFTREMQIALLGNHSFSSDNILDAGYEGLLIMSDNLVKRGLDPWNFKP